MWRKHYGADLKEYFILGHTVFHLFQRQLLSTTEIQKHIF